MPETNARVSDKADPDEVERRAPTRRNIFADRLIRDIIVQVSLVLGLGLLIWFFSQNYFSQGNDISWAFLPNPAGVDPSDPIVLPVTARSSVLSLFGFGLLNTLIVAICGIFLATILGFIMGVMRLSSNFLLSRIAQVYIEVLRNIPLTVILLFLSALLLLLPGIGVESPITIGEVLFHNFSFDMPSLKFGNGDGTGTWLGLVPFNWTIFPTQFGPDGAETTNWWVVAGLSFLFLGALAATFFRLIPRLRDWSEANKVNGRVQNRQRKSLMGFVVAGVLTLLILLFFSVETTFPPLVGWSMLAVFLIGVLWANALKSAIANWADDRLDATGTRPKVDLLGWVVFFAVIFVLFVLVGGPVSTETFVFNDKGRAVFGFSVPVSLIALIAALAIYTAAFIAEIVRAGIQSVNQGQHEAAAALGLRPGRILNLITIPQALKVIVPPLSSQYMNLAKNSSLAYLLQFPDVFGVLANARNNTGRELEIIFIILLSYLAISLTISVAMNYVNARVQLVER